MPLQYNSPPHLNAPLAHGEILFNLLELAVVPSDVETLHNEKKSPQVIRRTHPFALIISQECDLDWDWKYRTSVEVTRKDEKDERKWLPYVQFCDMFLKEDVRWKRGFNSALWTRVTSNQDERYLKFEQAQIDNVGDQIPELFVDFKRVFSMPTDYVYWLISSNYSIRKAIIPDPYIPSHSQRAS